MALFMGLRELVPSQQVRVQPCMIKFSITCKLVPGDTYCINTQVRVPMIVSNVEKRCTAVERVYSQSLSSASRMHVILRGSCEKENELELLFLRLSAARR